MRRPARMVLLAVSVPMLLGTLALPAAARPSGKNSDLIRRSATQTAHQGSAHISGRVTLAGGPRDGSFGIDGVLDLRHHTSRLTMDLSSLLGKPARVELRQLSGVLYFDFGSILAAAGQTLPPELANVKWVKLDLTKLGLGSGSTTGTSSLGADAAAELQRLQAISNAPIRRVGTEDVRGVATTHYQADVNYEAALQRLPAGLQHQFQQQFSQFTKQLANPTHVPVDLWVDHAGLIRRLGLAIKISPTSGASMTVSESFDLYDFGATVTVQAPNPSDVTDFSTLAGSLGAGAGGTA